jgi:hypothetical protein
MMATRLAKLLDISNHFRPPELVGMPLNSGHKVGGKFTFTSHANHIVARFTEQSGDFVRINEVF